MAQAATAAEAVMAIARQALKDEIDPRESFVVFQILSPACNEYARWRRSAQDRGFLRRRKKG
jgi:hypothetical protein